MGRGCRKNIPAWGKTLSWGKKKVRFDPRGEEAIRYLGEKRIPSVRKKDWCVRKTRKRGGGEEPSRAALLWKGDCAR